VIIAKLVVVPALILAASYAARKWGSFVGGALTGLPIVAGPLSFFIAYEQGDSFAILSANSTLLSVWSVAVFCFAYSWSAIRYRWYSALILGWLAYFMASIVVSFVSLNSNIALMVVLVTIAGLIKMTPNSVHEIKRASIPKLELLCRMLFGIFLVIIVSKLAYVIGPKYSGILTVFPTATTVMVVFTHKYSGGATAAVLLKGIMMGLVGLALFYYSLLKISNYVGFNTAFMCASVLVVLIQFSIFSPMKKLLS
jgi:hypothetical protein